MSYPVRVLILQPIIPSYRRRVFEELSQVGDPVFTIIAGASAVEPIPVLNEEGLTNIRHQLVENHFFRLGKKIVFSWQPNAWQLIRQAPPDCVVVHGGIYDLTSWVVLLWGRAAGCPVLAWTIGLQRPERGLKLWARRFFYSLAQGLLLYGDYPKRLLSESGMDPSRMYVIYNSLDVVSQRAAERDVTEQQVSALRTLYRMSRESRNLIFIGRIVPRKRLAILIESFSRLLEKGCDMHLFLIGDGSDVSMLKALAQRLGYESRIHFVGALYDETMIAQYMKLSHATVIPEAGLPIIHPMGYGLPAIISDNIEQHGTEWEAVQEGKTGFFFRDGDVDDLAAAIEKCFVDERLRREMAQNCRDCVEARYTAQRHAERILEGVRCLGGLRDSGL